MRLLIPTFGAFLFLLLFSAPGRADETLCASEQKAFVATSSGTREYQQTLQAWNECEARAVDHKKEMLAETGTTWAQGLNPIPEGGWALLGVSPDGTFAVFGSRRHETRNGNVVAVWLRLEYRESKTDNGTSYQSMVQRALYDCTRIVSKAISTTYYSENNLSGDGPSYAYDEGKVTWSPVIPGTLGDSLLEWACKTSKAAPAKTQ